MLKLLSRFVTPPPSPVVKLTWGVGGPDESPRIPLSVVTVSFALPSVGFETPAAPMVRSAPNDASISTPSGSDLKSGVTAAISLGLSSPSESPSAGFSSMLAEMSFPVKLILALRRLSRICPLMLGMCTVIWPVMSRPAPRLPSVPITRCETSSVADTLSCTGCGVRVFAVLI